MRKTIALLSLALVIIASCKDATLRESSRDEQELAALEEKVLAVEIISDYRLISYDRPLDETADAEFIDAETMSAMRKSRLYRGKMAQATKGGIDSSPDTLSVSEQIPFCADITESTLIYQDGRSAYMQETDLNPELNPLLSFHETEMDLSKCVAKVEIKEGMATTYNNKGEILSQNEVAMPDYSEYLEEMENAKAEASAETKSGIKRDINWLRNKMEAQCATKAGGASSYKIYEHGDKVVLEQYINGTKADEGTTVRTILSSDIARNYGFDQLEGGKLKVRCRHSFENSSLATKSSNMPVKDVSDDNPSKTILEEITCLSDGTPMLKVLEKNYRRNTIKFNIK